jgi:hypothetical protein
MDKKLQFINLQIEQSFKKIYLIDRQIVLLKRLLIIVFILMLLLVLNK